MKKLLIILAVAFALRFYGLGTYPPGPTNDEVAYFYNAFSISETGKDIIGENLPLYTRFSSNIPFMPVSTYLVAISYKIFGVSMFTSRLPFAVMGVLGIGVLYLIIWELFKNKRLALLSTLAMTISPWSFHESRIGYEAIPSLLFLLLAVYITLLATKLNKSLFLALPFFILSLFSYRAHNIIYLPLVLVLFWYIWPTIKNRRRAIIEYFVGVLVILAFFWVGAKASKGDYATEIVFSSKQMSQYALEVNSARQNSSAPSFLNSIFINKATFLFRDIKTNYLKAFSTEYLFISGETNGVRTMWTRGQFFYFEIIFITLGIFYFLKRKERREFILLISFILIGPLGTAISNPTYGMRTIFMLPFLLSLVAAGWLFLFDKISQLMFLKKRLIIVGFLLLYFSGGASYLFQYYYRYPIYASRWWSVDIRDGFTYLDKNVPPISDIYINTPEIYDILQYAFYKKSSPKEIQELLANDTFSKNDILDYGNIHFLRKCYNPENLFTEGINTNVYLMLGEECVKPKQAPLHEVKERGNNSNALVDL